MSQIVCSVFDVVHTEMVLWIWNSKFKRHEKYENALLSRRSLIPLIFVYIFADSWKNMQTIFTQTHTHTNTWTAIVSFEFNIESRTNQSVLHALQQHELFNSYIMFVHFQSNFLFRFHSYYTSIIFFLWHIKSHNSASEA